LGIPNGACDLTPQKYTAFSMKKMKVKKKNEQEGDYVPDQRTCRTPSRMQGTKMQTLVLIGIFDDPSRAANGLRHIRTPLFLP
jgi:hypothetical protein